MMASISHAPAIWGFAHPRENAASLFYTRRVDARAAHIVDQNLELASAVAASVGGAPDDSPPSFLLPFDPGAERWAREEIDRMHADRVAIINPGAGWGAKQWPAERYAEVARWLTARDVTPLINFGPGEEDLAREVLHHAPGAQLLQASMPRLIAMTRRATLFIGGDTGPMHLAAALGVAVVALFGPTDPERNGPYCQRRVVLRSAQSLTSYSHRNRVDAGLISITSTEAIAAAEQLLES
jgi:heptosyltransferase-1